MCEYVSVTDVKNEIEISDVLQFRLLMHMSRVQRPAQRRLLEQIMCRKTKSARCAGSAHADVESFLW